MTKLTLIAGGKSAAERFEALVQPHYEVLYRTAYRLTRSTHDAEDLAQEVCVRAYPRLEEIERLDRPRGWLLRVMYRVFVDSVRRYEHAHVGSLETVDANALVADEPDPEDLLDQGIRARQLNAAWRHLDNEQRALLALHDIEGHSLAELQEVTGLKQGTLKSRLFRARVRLGKLIKRGNDETALSARSGAGR